MKNFKFHFGYSGYYVYDWDYKLCKNIRLVPSVSLRLFNDRTPYKHIVEIGWCKWFWRWDYIKKQNRWRFYDMTNI